LLLLQQDLERLQAPVLVVEELAVQPGCLLAEFLQGGQVFLGNLQRLRQWPGSGHWLKWRPRRERDRQ